MNSENRDLNSRRRPLPRGKLAAGRRPSFLFLTVKVTRFQEVRDALFFLRVEQGYISEEELLLLLEEYTSKNPGFTYNEYDRFGFDRIQKPDCKYEFRIEKSDIALLADLLKLLEVFRCSQRTVASKSEGLCMLLKGTEYPCRYNVLADRFPKSA